MAAPTLVSGGETTDTDRHEAHPDSNLGEWNGVDDLMTYARARAKARRTASFRLRRQERRLTARARLRPLDNDELARLAAARTELQARGDGRPWPRTWRRSHTPAARIPRAA